MLESFSRNIAFAYVFIREDIFQKQVEDPPGVKELIFDGLKSGKIDNICILDIVQTIQKLHPFSQVRMWCDVVQTDVLCRSRHLDLQISDTINFHITSWLLM